MVALQPFLNLLIQNDEAKNYSFYTMTYKGNYGFDDYLEVGSETVLEYK